MWLVLQMNGVVQIGPLAMATERLVAVIAIWTFLALIPWLFRRDEKRPSKIVWVALAVGVLTARLGYVAQHWKIFSEDPLAVLYMWQGGYSPLSGIIAAAAVLALGLPGIRAKLKSVGGLAAIAGLWFAVSQIGFSGQPPMLPPGLTATRLDGQTVSLDAMRGKPFVLNFWATWCPPCLREMPMLARVSQERPEPPIFFVNQGEDAAVVAKFIADQKFEINHAVLDRSGTIAQAVGATALPSTLFVDSTGHIRISHYGEISRAALEDGLDTIQGQN